MDNEIIDKIYDKLDKITNNQSEMAKDIALLLQTSNNNLTGINNVKEDINEVKKDLYEPEKGLFYKIKGMMTQVRLSWGLIILCLTCILGYAVKELLS